MGGKSDAPAPPDYVGQAQTQAAGNLAAARSQTSANRINQITPYGQIKYTQSGGDFDQAGYDRAMAEYRSRNDNPAFQQYYAAGGTRPIAPTRDQFMSNPDQWASEIELSDTGRQLLDADSRARLGLAGLQDTAMGRVRDTLGQPFDMSGLQDMQTNIDPATGMDSWTKASDLIMQRMNPDLDAQQASLDTKLANQGVTQGSEAWGIGQRQFAKQRNDAGIGAQLAGAQLQQQMFQQALAGANLKNTGRQQQLTERTALRQIPLNELSALRSGAQVTNPTFNTPGQQGQTSGPDLMGASQAQYGAQVGQVNAQNAQTASTNNAALGTVAMAAAYFF